MEFVGLFLAAQAETVDLLKTLCVYTNSVYFQIPVTFDGTIK